MALKLDPGYRAALMELRALSTDEHGNEIYVGLSLAESEEYHRLIETVSKSRAERSRYLDLNEKHDRVRIQVVFAEGERRSVDRLN